MMRGHGGADRAVFGRTARGGAAVTQGCGEGRRRMLENQRELEETRREIRAGWRLGLPSKLLAPSSRYNIEKSWSRWRLLLLPP